LTQELEQQFVKLLEENQNIVHKVCRVYTNNSDAHKDLFQEVTIQLWKAYPKFRGESKFSTWMYKVAINTAITLYRKSKRQIQTNDITDFQYKLESEEYDGEIEEQMRLLYKAIHQLSDIEKALILLYLEDKPYKEIADTMGITEVNARVKVNRIKAKLKTILNP
jgi:RNA polymerase sigma factor (sigma-70 family)